MVVILDPGHGINTSGKRSPDSSLMEYEFNQDIVTKAKELLKDNPTIKVVVTRENDAIDKSLSARCILANNSKGDICISIHANAFNPPQYLKNPDGTVKTIYKNEWNSGNGFEIFYSTKKEKESLALANLLYTNMQHFLVKNTIRLRRIENNSKTNFYMLNAPKMPSILVEYGFYTNHKECELLKSNEFRIECAKLLVKTIMDWELRITPAKK